MAKRKRDPISLPDPTQVVADMPGQDFGRAFVAAMLMANEDGCDCRACQALRKANRMLLGGLITEEEENA